VDGCGSRAAALGSGELDSATYDEPMGSAVLDTVDNNAEAAEVYCLLVAKVYHRFWPVFRRIKNRVVHLQQDWDRWVLGGLLLVPGNTPRAPPRTYRRVGLFHIDPDYDNRFLCAAQEKTLRLI
jgi:hypothetical protein